MIEKLGLTGLIFNLLGSILLINSFVAFRSTLRKVQNVSGDLAFKYFRRIYISMGEHIINKYPDHPYVEIIKEHIHRWKNYDLPDAEEVIAQYKDKREDAKKYKEAKRKNNSKLRRSYGIIKDIQNSYILKAMIFKNPYFLILITMILLKKIINLFQKYQIKIGITFIVLGQIFLIIEKISTLQLK